MHQLKEVIPNVESIPRAAIAIPYNPYNLKDKTILMPIKRTGSSVDSIPNAKPLIIKGAGPDGALLARSSIGF